MAFIRVGDAMVRRDEIIAVALRRSNISLGSSLAEVVTRDGQRFPVGNCYSPDGEAKRDEIVAQLSPGRVIDAAYLAHQHEFSQNTFGPGQRTKGVIDHISKELKEIEADPQDLFEWVDVIILSFDGALRAGHAPQAILDGIAFKQAKNEQREWPDWRTADLDKAIEHVRT